LLLALGLRLGPTPPDLTLPPLGAHPTHHPSGPQIYFTACTDIQPQKNADGYWDTYRWGGGGGGAARGAPPPRPPRGPPRRSGWLLDVAQGAPAGRLLVYDPATRETAVLAKGFYYANGVALAPNGEYLMMVETNRIRVHRHWLKGPKVGGSFGWDGKGHCWPAAPPSRGPAARARSLVPQERPRSCVPPSRAPAQAGTTEVAIDHLPGVPDGVSRASDGNFWVAVLTPVPPIAKLLGEPGVRAAFAWMPDWARPAPMKRGIVIKVGRRGGGCWGHGSAPVASTEGRRALPPLPPARHALLFHMPRPAPHSHLPTTPPPRAPDHGRRRDRRLP
jgi:hypothetical protein